MSVINKPDIEDVDEEIESYVKTTFYPDYKLLGMEERLTDDMIALLKKRVYDILICAHRNDSKTKKTKKVRVWLDGEELTIKSFEDYIRMHYEHDVNIVYDGDTPRWKVGVVVDKDSKFDNISYVNGICTYQGGTHVNHIMNQIIKKTVEYVKDIHKITIKPERIKDYFHIYIDSVIVDPSFNSQAKEKLQSRETKFGSSYKVDKEFMEKLYKTGYIDEIISDELHKQSREVSKTDGKKSISLVGIDGLKDADRAGTSKSSECTLIITEGDSARKYAVDGISIVGCQNFGVWKIRGKFINVGNATLKQLNENKEFVNLKKILGLVQKEIYTDVKKLRYGHILILTDQDLDGSHIKGLVMSMFRNFWPELLQIEGFIQSLSTPIIKIFKKTDTRCQKALNTFYTLQDYKKWENEIGVVATRKFSIKYYKGLGTSSASDAHEIFEKYDKHVISYIWGDDESEESSTDSENSDDSESSSSEEEDDDELDSQESKKPKKIKKNMAVRKVNKEMMESNAYDALSMAFDEERVPERKKWLRKYDPNDIIEYSNKRVTFKEFVDKDLIHFANYANIRMIASVCDGYKPSLRKGAYGMSKKNTKSEIKVAQLGPYVASITAYKHGEQSITEAIVGMAQNFPGANNINIFYPSGNFGTRTGNDKGELGGDSSSPRYIYVSLEPIIPYIFRNEDNSILKLIEDEGEIIEPVSYCPIIPMILVNGSNGVGYGYSSNIPSYNPIDVINNLMRNIEGKDIKEMIPYYFGFTGTIEKIKLTDKQKQSLKNKNKTHYVSYKMIGTYEIIDEDTVLITEIPVVGKKASIKQYVRFLEKRLINGNTTVKKEKDTKKKKKEAEKIFVSVKESCGNNTINIRVKFANNILQKLNREGEDAIIKALGLSATINTSNMHLYDEFSRLTRYETIDEIYGDFYKYRLKMYKKRKAYLLKKIFNEMNIAKYKVKFIKEIVEETFIISKRKKDSIIKELKEKKYPMLHTDLDAIDPKELEDEDIKNENENEKNEDDENKVKDDETHKKLSIKSYSYLTDMKLFSLTYEKMEKLKTEYDNKKIEYEYYENITEKDLWKKELKELIIKYNEWIDDRTKTAKTNDLVKYDKKGKKIHIKK